MENIEQIKQICVETNNKWFLTQLFTQIALYDLKINELFENKNISDFTEMERSNDLDKLHLNKGCNYIYDYKKEEYVKGTWIIPEKIDGIMPGFMLLKCCNILIDNKQFTHELVFACVRHKYRKKGILKSMVNGIPKEWVIWLEANSNDIVNVENVWAKCGFVYHTTIYKSCLILKRR